MTVYLGDVINIPERVGADDYALRLTDATNDEHIAAESISAPFACPRAMHEGVA